MSLKRLPWTEEITLPLTRDGSYCLDACNARYVDEITGSRLNEASHPGCARLCRITLDERVSLKGAGRYG